MADNFFRNKRKIEEMKKKRRAEKAEKRHHKNPTQPAESAPPANTQAFPEPPVTPTA